MTNDPKRAASDGRRRTVKTLMAGGAVAATGAGLPRSWTTPVVNAVVLPAHAQMSPAGSVYWGTGLDDNLGFGPPATFTICAVVDGDTATVTVQGSANIMRRQGELAVDGSEGAISAVDVSPDATCEDLPEQFLSRPARIDSISESEMVLAIFARGAEVWVPITVPAADACGSFQNLDGTCRIDIEE